MAPTIDHPPRKSYAQQGIRALENLIADARIHADAGCQMCRVDAIALQAALEWLRALGEFQRGMYPELYPGEPDPPTSGG